MGKKFAEKSITKILLKIHLISIYKKIKNERNKINESKIDKYVK